MINEFLLFTGNGGALLPLLGFVGVLCGVIQAVKLTMIHTVTIYTFSSIEHESSAPSSS